jgi:meso-butanediol dehydrogenase / (S,S)-butanediol dehydrogenase / diacetyl reductase
MQIEGKTVIVTGAARGIGRGIAQTFRRAGAQVVVADLGGLVPARSWVYEMSAADQLQKTAGELDAFAVETDVTDAASCRALVAAARERFGHVDVLVNNAGVVRIGPLEDYDEESWDRTFDVNVKGVFLMSKAAIPALVEAGGGAIVNIASVAGLRGSANMGCYCASKFAVVGLSESMARELAPRGIRVNAVCPGIVAGTEMRTGSTPKPVDALTAVRAGAAVDTCCRIGAPDSLPDSHTEGG